MTRKYCSILVLLIVSLSLLCFPSYVSLCTRRSFYDRFNGKKLRHIWNIEDRGGDYSLDKGILTLSSTGQASDSMTSYIEYVPKGENFMVSARVKATSLAAFALRIHAGNLPIFGSTQGAQIEFDNGIGDKHFMAVWEPSGGGWTWVNIHIPVESGVWFILQMQIQRNPFTITFNVYSDAETLLGTETVNSLGFNYADIRYICLEVWSGPDPPLYHVDWFRITSMKA